MRLGVLEFVEVCKDGGRSFSRFCVTDSWAQFRLNDASVSSSDGFIERPIEFRSHATSGLIQESLRRSTDVPETIVLPIGRTPYLVTHCSLARGLAKSSHEVRYVRSANAELKPVRGMLVGIDCDRAITARILVKNKSKRRAASTDRRHQTGGHDRMIDRGSNCDPAAIAVGIDLPAGGQQSSVF